MPAPIGISTWNNGAYKAIETWLRACNNDIEFVELSAAADPVAALSHCGGLILPGGCDPNPALYGASDPLGLCAIDDARDTLELTLIYHALTSAIPILGICRGFQIVNVALGGSLILDLPSAGIHSHQLISPLGRESSSGDKGGLRGNSSSPHGVGGQKGGHLSPLNRESSSDNKEHPLSPLGRESSSGDKGGLRGNSSSPHFMQEPNGNPLSPLGRESSSGDKGGQRGNSSDAWHDISIVEDSLLHCISGTLATTVNSNHHQGICKVASCLKPTAFAPDGVIEALEWNPDCLASYTTITFTPPLNDPNAFSPLTPYPLPLLLLHFHPERMEYSHPCAKGVAEEFITMCLEHQH